MTLAKPCPCPRRVLRNDSGLALIIVLLLLLVLSSIGLIAVQASSINISLEGSRRVSQIARNVAVSGGVGTMAFAAMNPSGFNQFVQVNRNAANLGVVSMGDISSSFFDMNTDGSGSFGREVVSINTAFWQSTMISQVTTHRAPGFEMGEYCFRKYGSVTDGVYRNDLNPADPNDLLLKIERNAQSRMMSSLFVGPIICP